VARRLRERMPAWALPWLAGAIVGVLVWTSQGLLVGYGHLAIHAEMFGELPWWALLALAAGGIVATAVTLNGGGSGGVFTPSLYVGAATGGGVGVLLARLFPTFNVHPASYGLVGMGALIAGATDAPITGILLVFEMTNDYGIVLPLMLTVVIAHAIARRLEPDSLYSGWLRRRGQRIDHGADRDLLAGLRVRDAYDPRPRTVDEAAPVSVLLTHLRDGNQTLLPVVDPHGGVAGVITISDLARLAADSGHIGELIRAADVAQPSEIVGLGDSLLDAVRKMGVRGTSAVPVVDDRTGRLVGLISREHVVNAYERQAAAVSTNEHPITRS
jgi:CIC family chloride channel protein